MTNEIDMRVGMDVAQAKAELESLKRSVSSFAAEVQAAARNLQLKVTAQADTAKALAELATLKQASGGIESIVKVSVDSYLRKLLALRRRLVGALLLLLR